MIPYIIMLLLCGLPLLFMELSMGQYTRRGPIGAIGKMCPIFQVCLSLLDIKNMKKNHVSVVIQSFIMRKLYYFFSYLQGAGVATVVLTFWLATYYNVIIGWAIFYLFSSFADPLPWVSCNNTWNTPFCLDTPVNQTQQPVEIIEDYCSEEKKLNTTGVVQTTSSSQEFYEYVRQSNICNMSFKHCLYILPVKDHFFILQPTGASSNHRNRRFRIYQVGVIWRCTRCMGNFLMLYKEKVVMNVISYYF